MARISVVVPVYNVEKYLRQSLDSICAQTFDDIEVICINDGSTDSSLSILNEYWDKDSRFKLITQKNRGAGASRNVALEHVCGEYVYFMDSDDYLERDAFEKLYSNFSAKEFDFVMFKISNFNEQTNERIDDDYYNMPYLKKRVGENSFDYNDVSDFAMDLCVCPPGILFNREFIADIRFPENLLFEDNVFFTHALFKASKIYFYDEFLYNRRKRADSTTTPISIRSLDTIEITNRLIDLCYEFNHKKHLGALYYRIFHNIYQIFKKVDESQKDIFFDKIKEEYLKNREKWENEDYFKNRLKAKYRHIYKCAIKSKNARKFEKCVDNFSNESRLKKLRKKLL